MFERYVSSWDKEPGKMMLAHYAALGTTVSFVLSLFLDSLWWTTVLPAHAVLTIASVVIGLLIDVELDRRRECSL